MIYGTLIKAQISGVLSMAHVLFGWMFKPWALYGDLLHVCPGINSDGYLYDKTTGQLLFDAVTGLPIAA